MDKVIVGKYRGKTLDQNGDIIINWSKRYKLDKSNIKRYEIVEQNTKKSGKSALGRGLVGGALLGPLGALAGGLSAKNKNKYKVKLYHKCGRTSIIEIKEQTLNKILNRLG